MARCAAPAAGRWRSSASSTAPTASSSSRSARRSRGRTGSRRWSSRSRPGGRPTRSSLRDAAQLAWIVNLGCIDLNPHPVRAEDLDHPDELRVDLDPVPGRAVGDVGDVAMVDAGGARGPRADRLAQDVGLARHPHQRAHRAALGVRRGAPRGAGAGARGGAARAGHRDQQVVEGRAARRLPRLQPERQGPHGRVARIPCGPTPDARVSMPLRWDEVPTPSSATSRWPQCRRSFAQATATRTPASTTRSARWTALLELSQRSTRRRARATRRGRRNYRKQEGEPPRVQPSRQRRPTRTTGTVFEPDPSLVAGPAR